MKTFGKVFKEETDKRNLSIQQVAEKLNISNVYVSYLRSGKNIPGLKLAKKIKAMFGIPCVGSKECFQWPPEKG